MPKDFYSNDHSIKVGVPNSSSGDLMLEAEEGITLKSSASGSFKGILEIDKFGAIILKPGTDSVGDSYGSVNVKGSLLQIGEGSATPPVSLSPTEKCLVYVHGPTKAYTDDDDHVLYTETGNIQFSAPNGTVTVDSPTTTLTGDLVVTGTISYSGAGTAGVINESVVEITSTTTTDLTAGTDITISAGDDITIVAGTSSPDGLISLKAGTLSTSPRLTISESAGNIGLNSPNITLDLDASGNLLSSGGSWTLGSLNSFTASGDAGSGYFFDLSNTSSNSAADLMNLSFDNIATPNTGNNWIRFMANGTSRGAIQGSSASNGYYGLYVSSSTMPPYGGGSLFTLPGYVQYASGSEDFGEWLPLGDESEWEITEEIKQNFIKKSIFPIEEGVVLYVRDSKVWRNGPGRGMIVTHRAALVGNQNFKEDGRLGVIMSFIGQVPAYVEGSVNDGDILVPVEGANHCRAINPDEISFSDYRKAIGTAWGKKVTPEVGPVNCAIGIK